jgi:hypothetical protein
VDYQVASGVYCLHLHFLFSLPENSQPATPFCYFLPLRLTKSNPLPMKMNSTIKEVNNSRRDMPAAAAVVPSNYFPSRVPGEIRNSIYKLQDAMASAREQTSERSLIICRRLYSVNRQIRDEFTSMVPLTVHLDKVPATFSIFFPPSCLSGHCSHSKCARRTTEVHVVLPIQILGSRDLTGILRTKYYSRNLSIDFSVEVPRFYHDIQKDFSVCRLFNKVFVDPFAALMAPFTSGALMSIWLIPPPYSRRDEPFTWALGMRKSPTWLGKADRELIIGCLTYLQQESAAFLVNARACASVQDKKGVLWGEWIGCEETQRLVRKK